MRITRARGWRVLVTLAALAALAAVPTALSAAGPDAVPASAAEGTALWFVQLASPPAADGTSLATIKNEQAAFRSQAKAAGLSFQERYAYSQVWNGVSVSVKGGASALSTLPGVKGVYPVGVATVEPDATIDPELQTALTMTGADVAQSELGLTGAGVKVGVVDTGIDYDHPDLGGDGVTRTNSTVFPTARVQYGYDFVGDAYNADQSSPSYNPIPTPDPYPDDCFGHGTHVAGIVGASGNFATGGARGVAPGVTFGAYRVFGCDGSANDDVILAALERAFTDGMDIINMSLGDAFNNWPQAPLAAASDTLVNHGVVVVASIGNSGADGLYSAGAPGVGNKVIGVASYDNIAIRLKTFTVSPDATAVGYQTMTGAANPPTSGSLPIVKTGTTTTTNDGCNPIAQDLTGEAVLIRRGTCTFRTKAINALNAGAAAVIVYNNSAGNFAGTVAGTSPPGDLSTTPVVSISNTAGALLDSRIAAGPTTITWTNVEGSFPNPTGGQVSSFSSYGLAADLSMKPDIGAPGGLIRSTWPLEAGGYATISGTSMASPHVAGGVALLLQARPHTPPNAVRAILQNSADPHNFSTTAFVDSVQHQGAGMLDIPGAVLSTTRITPGKLSLGEGSGGPSTQTLTLSNSTGSTVTYDLSNQPAIVTGPNTFTVGLFIAPASVSFTQAGVPVTSLTVAPGGTATVDATVAPPFSDNDYIYGGYIVFTPQGGGAKYRVPYVGLTGDYQAIVDLTPTANGFPWLAKLVPPNFVKQSDGATFTFAGTDFAHFLLHLNHQVQELKATVNRTSDGKSFGLAFDLKYLSRNQTSTGFFNINWDGKAAKGPNVSDVPNGTYTVTLTATKPLGTSSETETWTSPTFTIARP